MWIKFQASCSSSEQALAFLQSRLGGEDPDPPVPVYPYLSFEIPTNLSERIRNIAIWESVKDSFPDDWHDHEFRLAEGPYPWCESLSDDCDCQGGKGRLDAVFCSDFGLQGETASRAGKSPNVRHMEYIRQLRQRLANSQPLAEVLREELSVKALYPFTCIHSPLSFLSSLALFSFQDGQNHRPFPFSGINRPSSSILRRSRTSEPSDAIVERNT